MPTGRTLDCCTIGMNLIVSVRLFVLLCQPAQGCLWSSINSGQSYGTHLQPILQPILHPFDTEITGVFSIASFGTSTAKKIWPGIRTTHLLKGLSQRKNALMHLSQQNLVVCSNGTNNWYHIVRPLKIRIPIEDSMVPQHCGSSSDTAITTGSGPFKMKSSATLQSPGSNSNSEISEDSESDESEDDTAEENETGRK